MSQQKLVEVLLEKAAHDEYVLDKLLPDDEAPLDMYGLHAQQAVEKLLKATVSAAGGVYDLTHDVADLMDDARALGARVPPRFDELRALTPYASEFRYEAYHESAEEVEDKQRVRQLIADLRTWVEAFVEQSSA